jgi:uncharacterized protein
MRETTMTQQTQSASDIVKAYFQAFADNDPASIERYFTPDIEYTVIGMTIPAVEKAVIPWLGHYHGHDGAKQFFSHLQNNIEVIGFSPQSFIEQGDQVAVFGAFTYKAVSTQKEFESDYAIRIQMRDGKISHYHFFENTFAIGEAFRHSGSWDIENDGQRRMAP